MKKIKNIASYIFYFGFILSLQSCKDWTEVESITDKSVDLDATIKTDEYFASLREWKKTPGLPQIFVWFDNWNGVAPTGENSLRGLPDSVTIASNWGGHPKFDLSPERKADMEYVQKVKGTKVVVTLFSAKVGDDMPEDPIYNIGNSSDPAVIRPAIRKYAEAIYDAVVATGYDGFDWDYEPIYAGNATNYLWRNIAQRTMFVEELGYYFGRGSQRTERDGRKPAIPGLLYIIDGEIGIGDGMDKNWESQYVDYYVLQAYGSTTIANHTSRVLGVINDMSDHIAAGRITAEEVVSRTIMTENFESYANTGGGFLSMSSFVYNNLGVEHQIGGSGLYRSGFDYLPKGKGDYDGSPEYYFLRRGITNLYKVYNERKVLN
ncbi:glycoside hydrolase family 18 [Sphingobacterium hungaricum]|uniref:Endoglycosidase n=1 Tax=Sphingobacterium hungaricum TaxID=2082723 RepID=A0A928UXE8_9SPHI|nr:glycoside hydrolase family 18 [Sphingobacterium hungaricum]MBE8715000.1 endoglycosidase [Sphingobacterium hungaricum]